MLECVEHIVVAEGRFLGWLQNPGADLAPPMDKQKEAKLLLGVSGRSQRVNAPEPVHPTGRFATLAEALAQFERHPREEHPVCGECGRRALFAGSQARILWTG